MVPGLGVKKPACEAGCENEAWRENGACCESEVCCGNEAWRENEVRVTKNWHTLSPPLR